MEEQQETENSQGCAQTQQQPPLDALPGLLRASLYTFYANQRAAQAPLRMLLACRKWCKPDTCMGSIILFALFESDVSSPLSQIGDVMQG